MSDELKMDTFVVDRWTVETGRIIPSPALAEAAILGAAQIIAERDALRAERDAAQAEAAKYKALWEDVPWEAIEDAAEWPKIERPELSQVIWDWMDGNAPKPQGEEA